MTEAFIHPTACVDDGASLGPHTKVWHFAHVSTGAQIGSHCSIGQNVFVGRNVTIGNRVKIQNNVSVYERVDVADDVFLGPSCVFTNVINPRAFIERKSEYRATVVERGVTVGANATVVCGHRLGEYAFVGAGAVVTKDVVPYALVVGNPARRVGFACRCGVRLQGAGRIRCSACSASYQVLGDSCKPVADSSDDPPVPLLDLALQNAPLLGELQAAFSRVVSRNQYILGKEVEEFETSVATHIGVPHAVGVSSGTDAILIALMALGITPGDEVITTTFSFFATAGCIARMGAKPVFVDIEPDTFNIDVTQLEQALSTKTRAVIAVHLFGQPYDVVGLRAFATANGLPVIEDAAQAIGTRTELGPAGAVGQVGCFSFFPSKNLGGLGDGGLVTTTDPALSDRLRVLRVHGGKPKYHHGMIGGNFRLDALQAAFLKVKLPHLAAWTRARRENALAYNACFEQAGLSDGLLRTPQETRSGHVWNQYVIATPFRDGLRAHLLAKHIGTEVYYPVPLHLQPCFADLNYREGSLPIAERAAKEVLALPIFPELQAKQRERVATEVVTYLKSC